MKSKILNSLYTDIQDCECNGFVDNIGGGECRQQAFGHWWCYVNKDNDCPDSQEDSSMPVFSRSYSACTQGLL